MYVRLAFAVAAHLESEILIIDEVLAVGDDEFQKKCLGKMGEVSKGEGRTVLFVSHNMDSILRLCSKSAFLKNGSLIMISNTENVISKYLNDENKSTSFVEYKYDLAPGNNLVRLIKAEMIDKYGHNKINFFIDETVGIKIKFEVFETTEDLICGFNLYDQKEIHILSSHDLTNIEKKYNPGIYENIVWIPENFLAEGTHHCGIAAMSYKPFTVHFHDINKFIFNIVDPKNGQTNRGKYIGDFPGIIRPKLKWDHI